MRAVTGEIFIPEHLILPHGVIPLCEDSRLRTAVLATLPTLDNGGLAARQAGGDPDRGLRIPSASGEQAVPSAAGSGPTAKGKQAVAGSAATSGPSQARSSSGASSGQAGRRRLHRGNGTPVTESAAKCQRTAEDAGQGSSRASGPRGSSGVTAPPPLPPRDSSLRQQQQQRQPREQQQQQQQQREQPRVAPASPPREQQQQQKQSSSLRGRWRPDASGLVLFCPLPLFSVLRFLLKASSLCLPGLLAQAVLPPPLARQRGSRRQGPQWRQRVRGARVQRFLLTW